MFSVPFSATTVNVTDLPLERSMVLPDAGVTVAPCETSIVGTRAVRSHAPAVSGFMLTETVRLSWSIVVAGEFGAVECDINWDTVEVDGYVDEYRTVRGECAVDCRRKLAKDKGQGLPAGEPVFFLGGVAEAKEAAVNLYGAQHYAFEGEVLKQEADCRVVYLGYRNVLGDVRTDR